jgi:NADH dehydrogenase
LVRTDLRAGTADMPVPDAWGAGDNAAIADLAVDTPGAHTVPNAQHAVRQGKLLAANIVASLRGKPLKKYIHESLGVVATLGIGQGVFQSGRITVTGLAAWLMHRGYHVLAIPTWERKVRVLAVWLTALMFGRDIASLESAEHPRKAFVTEGEPDGACNRLPVTVSSSSG